jgi:outer membrane protein assembly factor BamB
MADTQDPTTDQPTTDQTDVPAAWIAPPTRPKRWLTVTGWAIFAVIMACIVAVIIVAVYWPGAAKASLAKAAPVRPVPQLAHTPDIESAPSWPIGAYLPVPDDVDTVMIGLTFEPDIVVASWLKQDVDTTWIPGSLVGVDLATSSIRWTRDFGAFTYQAAPGGIVVHTLQHLTVLDTRTGDTLAVADIQASDHLYYVLGDVVITSRDDTLCARPIRMLDTCRWQARDDGHVSTTGGGRWIDTGDGLLDTQTGRPAPFGTDVPADGSIRYWGPTPTQIFRDAGVGDAQTTQIWDTVHDAPVGDPVDLRHFAYTPDSDVLVLEQKVDDTTGRLQAYSWTTGKPLWAQPVTSPIVPHDIEMVATTVVTPTDEDVDMGCAAFAAATGKQIWSAPDCAYMSLGTHVAYAIYEDADGVPTTIEAHDATSPDFATLWSITTPYAALSVFPGTTRLIGLTGFNGAGNTVVWATDPPGEAGPKPTMCPRGGTLC